MLRTHHPCCHPESADAAQLAHRAAQLEAPSRARIGLGVDLVLQLLGECGATDGWQQSLDEYGPGGSPLTRHTVYGRDDIGRLNSLQRPEGTIGLGYDKASNLTRYTDNSGDTSYGYNTADQLTSLTMPTGTCTGLTYASPGSSDTGCVLFSLDDDGRRTGTKYPAGNLVQTNTLDNSGRITQIVAKSGGTGGTERFNQQYNYGGSPAADKATILSMVDAPAGGTSKTTTYSYDQLNELTVADTKVTSGGAQSAYERFCYDLAGNRLKYYRATPATNCSAASPAATSTYNGANQLTAATGVTPTGAAIAGTALSYDGNGAETAGKSAIGRTTAFGDRGQAATFTPAGGSAVTQSYSGSGNSDRVLSGTTTILPSPISPAPAWSKTGSNTTWTVRDPDGKLIAVRIGTTTNPASGTTYYPFTDNLGNVRAMTTAAGTTPNVAYAYSAFGATVSTTGTLVQPYRYGSGYTDDSTGLIKLGIRYYDPTHGRFTQQDPTGKDKYLYSYANNCATTLNDPIGSDPCGRTGALVLTGLGLAAFAIAFPALLPLFGAEVIGTGVLAQGLGIFGAEAGLGFTLAGGACAL